MISVMSVSGGGGIHAHLGRQSAFLEPAFHEFHLVRLGLADAGAEETDLAIRSPRFDHRGHLDRLSMVHYHPLHEFSVFARCRRQLGVSARRKGFCGLAGSSGLDDRRSVYLSRDAHRKDQRQRDRTESYKSHRETDPSHRMHSQGVNEHFAHSNTNETVTPLPI